jgi:hypothetical protein
VIVLFFAYVIIKTPFKIWQLLPLPVRLSLSLLYAYAHKKSILFLNKFFQAVLYTIICNEKKHCSRGATTARGAERCRRSGDEERRRGRRRAADAGRDPEQGGTDAGALQEISGEELRRVDQERRRRSGALAD